ncbi:MAG: hypothetical protein RJQ09_17990 [Cyclobacteriaceae bacterium]
MLSFFRINDPYRLVFVFVLLLIFRLPFIISGIPLSLPELNWMIVGEAMSSGKMLYRDIWENMGPFSAIVYQIVHWLFGKSQLAYQLIAILLVFIQALIFNRLLLINKAFNENTYIPALIYAICMSLNFEFLTLSPALMSLTFVILSINNIFKRIDNFTRDELFLNTGLYLGIATLFYFPSIVFLISTILSLVLFTSAIPRRVLLTVFGFAQMLSFAIIYYYWFDAGRELYFQFFWAPFGLDPNPYLGVKSLLLISIILIIFFIVSLFKLYSRTYYVNYQVKFQSVMLFTLLIGMLSFFLVEKGSSMQLVVLIPAVAFFLSHLFLLIEKRMKAEIVFTLFLILVFGYQHLADRELKWIGQLVDYEALFVKETAYDASTDERSLLVLGDDQAVYKNSSLATPYLNWKLAKMHFDKIDYYDVLVEVFENFEDDPPEVIIDLEERIPELFEKLPTIADQYANIREGVYLRTNTP